MMVRGKRRRIIFLFHLNCSMKHKYGVCQFKRYFYKLRKLQFGIKLIKPVKVHQFERLTNPTVAQVVMFRLTHNKTL